MQNNNKIITISDIAKGAGVSKTTVSRYLNGKYEYMSENTRKRIEAIINVSNFQPNNIARSLKSQKSMLVGLVVADIESPFTAAVIKGIDITLREAGYNLIIVNSDNNLQKEIDSINSLLSQRVDGLIVNSTSSHNPFLINLANGGMPIVLADRFIKDYNFDIVYFDCDIAISSAVDHIFNNGYATPAFFSQPYTDISPRYLRRNAFIQALSKHHIEDPERYTYEIDIHNEKVIYDSIKELLEIHTDNNRPPAIIAANTVILLHTLNAIRSMNLKVPEDISICGYDDWAWTCGMSWAPLIDNGITTLCGSSYDLGVLAATLLLERMKGSSTEKKSITIPVNLEPRNSTRPNLS